jgi:predicted nuclease of restriction endonuclease-like RecB superfamily
MSLAQGLVMFAQSLQIEIHDADTGLRRRLLKALRFRRLLATVRGDTKGVLTLEVSGPGSLLDQVNRYGMQLALFLPALTCCKHWQLHADLRLPRAGNARLTLSDEQQLVGDTTFLGFVPEEVRAVEQALRQRFPAWEWEEPPLLTHTSGEMIVPDLCLRLNNKQITIEFFHRWHAHAVERRLTQLAAGWGEHHVIGVDRAIAKRSKQLELHPMFLRHGFLFSDFPTPRALGEAVERLG